MHNRDTNKNLFEKLPHKRLEKITLPMIRTPPIVGVPSFTLWESGPLSPITCWNWNDLICLIKSSPNNKTISKPDNVDRKVLVLRDEKCVCTRAHARARMCVCIYLCACSKVK